MASIDLYRHRFELRNPRPENVIFDLDTNDFKSSSFVPDRKEVEDYRTLWKVYQDSIKDNQTPFDYDVAWNAVQTSDELAWVRKKASVHEIRTFFNVLAQSQLSSTMKKAIEDAKR